MDAQNRIICISAEINAKAKLRVPIKRSVPACKAVNTAFTSFLVTATSPTFLAASGQGGVRPIPGSCDQLNLDVSSQRRGYAAGGVYGSKSDGRGGSGRPSHMRTRRWMRVMRKRRPLAVISLRWPCSIVSAALA